MLVLGVLLISSLVGCAGFEAFPMKAVPGQTVALAAGWKQSFATDELTVTITPSSGPQIVYNPGDPAIRASINLYPDPVSWLQVGTAIGQNKTGIDRYNTGYVNGDQINSLYTNGDTDWWQTTVFVDLPQAQDLPTGIAQISISSLSGESYGPIDIDIMAGSSERQEFIAKGTGEGGIGLGDNIHLLERGSHYTVAFSDSGTIPYAIQMDLVHGIDYIAGLTGTYDENGNEISTGIGRAYVINPPGYPKSIQWNDDGQYLRVILLPEAGKRLSSTDAFKFYVAGGVTGLDIVPGSIQAFQKNGGPVSGITATISP